MKKRIIVASVTVLFLGMVITGIVISNNNKKTELNSTQTTEMVSSTELVGSTEKVGATENTVDEVNDSNTINETDGTSTDSSGGSSAGSTAGNNEETTGITGDGEEYIILPDGSVINAEELNSPDFNIEDHLPNETDPVEQPDSDAGTNEGESNPTEGQPAGNNSGVIELPIIPVD